MITLRLYKILKQIIYKINILNKNKIEIVKLWENASPTSSFGKQTVSLDLSDYGLIIAYGIESTTESKVISALAVKGKTHRLICLYNARQVREFTANDNGVTFENAYYSALSGTMASNNVYMIPIAIYGIKGVQ